MTDAPTQVAVQRWHHWVPGAAVAVMAAAATPDGALLHEAPRG